MSDQTDLAAARAIIETAKKAKADACWAEIQAVLEKHKCNLYGTPEFVSTAPSAFSVAVKLWVSAREN